MYEEVRRMNPFAEFRTSEGCFINELLNADADPDLSIARARVPPGVTTRRHRLKETAERYVMLSGNGTVEVEDLPAQDVSAGDIVIIPPGCRQRIANIGTEDLVFLAVCTPRFRPDNYEDIDSEPMQPDKAV